MSQNKLKDYQKQLFEYDYTLKKIDNILISTRLPQEEREHYQLSREACQKAKNRTSQEMADYAKQNRLSLLIAPLSKEEKEELISAMEKGAGDSTETIRFDDVRGESFYVEEKPVMPEITVYKTKKLSEHVVNEILENEVLENEVVVDDDLENDDLENENLEFNDLEKEVIESKDFRFKDNDVPDEKDFDFEEEKDFSDYQEDDNDSLYSPEVITFIKSLKKELFLFYGK